jgi:AcrR family transcriptional regulator
MTEKRSRNAFATRAAILQSARAAFVRSGYDGAGVREIAEGAGVTAMMVNRYFGSKQQLFAEVLEAANAEPVIATPENLGAPDRARRIAEALVAVTTPGATALDGFLILMRSASSPEATGVAKTVIEAMHQRNVSSAFAGEGAAERSAILLSLVAGLQIMRQVIGLEALASADPAKLARLLEPVVALLEHD